MRTGQNTFLLHVTTMYRLAVISLACASSMIPLQAAEEGRGLKPIAVTASDGSEIVRFTSSQALIIGNTQVDGSRCRA
jgi:hypothetical protein